VSFQRCSEVCVVYCAFQWRVRRLCSTGRCIQTTIGRWVFSVYATCLSWPSSTPSPPYSRSMESSPCPSLGRSCRRQLTTRWSSTTPPRTFADSSANGSVYYHVYCRLLLRVRSFLANVNYVTFAICYRRSVCLSSVCLWRWCALLSRLKFSAIFFTIR